MFRHLRLSSARSIRLANLLPSADDESQIEVTLVEADLDNLRVGNSTYEAFSYVWGSPYGTQPLSCNNKTLLVSPSCESALQHLRLKDTTRTLWVDAICVNQEKSKDGLSERAIQVPLMGEIYENALRTLCWLGEGLQYTSLVMRHLERIGECPSQRGLTKLLLFEETLRSKGLLDEESSCLDHIFCHPWHTRIWTVQEVSFSRECQVICGKSSLSWKQYSTAATFLIYEQFVEQMALQASKSMVSIDMRNVLRDYLFGRHISMAVDDVGAREEKEAQQRVFLTSCLTDVNQLQATDPKDKIYGLYAIYTALGISLPAVDYQKTVARVYTDTAVAMISWSASLDVLRDACSTNRDSTLPSWVPDWNDDQVRLFMPTSEATRGSPIVDCKLLDLSPTCGKLHTRGKVTGQVVILSGNPIMMRFPTRSNSVMLPILSDSKFQEVGDVEFLRLLVDQIRFFRELCCLLQARPELCFGEDPLNTFLDVLSLGVGLPDRNLAEIWIGILNYPNSQFDLSFGMSLAERWKAADKSNIVNWTPELTFCTVIAASLLTNRIKCDGNILSSHDAILDFMKEISMNLADQTVITVQDDLAGSVSLGTTFQSVEAGDLVVLLEGASWPIMLRPLGTEWSFIGPAFVLGMMDGEAWPARDDQLHDLTHFVLV